MEQFCLENHLSMANVAYVGDDINDLDCMQKAGFSACPANAEEEIKKASHYISKENGGEGAVRDVCNLMLKALNPS